MLIFLFLLLDVWASLYRMMCVQKTSSLSYINVWKEKSFSVLTENLNLIGYTYEQGLRLQLVCSQSMANKPRIPVWCENLEHPQSKLQYNTV